MSAPDRDQARAWGGWRQGPQGDELPADERERLRVEFELEHQDDEDDAPLMPSLLAHEDDGDTSVEPTEIEEPW